MVRKFRLSLTVITDIDIDFLRQWKNALLAYSTSDIVGKQEDRIINSIHSYSLGLYLGTIYIFWRACDSLYRNYSDYNVIIHFKNPFTWSCNNLSPPSPPSQHNHTDTHNHTYIQYTSGGPSLCVCEIYGWLPCHLNGGWVVGLKVGVMVEVAMAHACVGYKDGFHATWIKGE